MAQSSPREVRGSVAIIAALWVTFRIFKNAKQEAVTYTVVAAYLLLGLFLVVTSWSMNGFTDSVFGTIFAMGGLVVGGMAYKSVVT